MSASGKTASHVAGRLVLRQDVSLINLEPSGVILAKTASVKGRHVATFSTGPPLHRDGRTPIGTAPRRALKRQGSTMRLGGPYIPLAHRICRPLMLAYQATMEGGCTMIVGTP